MINITTIRYIFIAYLYLFGCKNLYMIRRKTYADVDKIILVKFRIGVACFIRDVCVAVVL